MALHGTGTKKMLKKRNKNTEGFTLIELILYIALSSIFMTASVIFAWDVVYGRIRSFVEQEVNQNMRLASKRIAYEIRNASEVNSTGTSLSLAMADSTRNPTVIDVSGGRIRIGYGSSGSCPTTSPCFLTDNLVTTSGLSFTDFSSSPNSLHVRFSFTISKTGGPDEFQETQTYTSSAELRSH